jgi:N,N'-diacetyllegionaminate synthase
MKKKIIIIAEIGVNHNGSLSRAKKLIDAAKWSGADYAKFQTYISEEVFSVNAPKAEYQKLSTNEKETPIEMGKKYFLSFKDHQILFRYCIKKKIKYLTTYHDIVSLKKNYIKSDFIKIGSGDINNFPFLNHVTKLKTKILLSTGASNFNEVKRAFQFLKKKNVSNKNIIILQCNSAYPTPLHDANVNVIRKYKNFFKTEVGYSDHTTYIEPSVAAVLLGASVIEKHITISKKLKGPDHQSSMLPSEFKRMVTSIHNSLVALGSKNKIITKSEKKNRDIIRKSLVASKFIAKGEKFTKSNVSIKRPGFGKPALCFFNLLGKKSRVNYKKDEFI